MIIWYTYSVIIHNNIIVVDLSVRCHIVGLALLIMLILLINYEHFYYFIIYISLL